MRWLFIVVVVAAACQRGKGDKEKAAPAVAIDQAKAPDAGKGVAEPPPPTVEQREAPLDVKAPPADAVRTSSGLVMKKLDAVASGETAKRNDTVSLVYTGWRQSTGVTFFSNRGKAPMQLPLANTAVGFAEAMQMMRKGERAMLWLPPSIAFKGDAPPGAENETLVYEVEIVDIQVAPPVPQDLAAPPANAKTLPSGTKYVVGRPATSAEKVNSWDTVTFNYSAWAADGRMFDSTEMRKRPATIMPYRQVPAMEEMLTTLLPGARVRFWVSAARMQQPKYVSGMPVGLLVYELELLSVDKGKKPPPPPPDVKAMPAGVKKTERGVGYKVLRTAKIPNDPGRKPTLADIVRVDYTGWTTDGRMFDSTVIQGVPQEQRLDNVIVGWQDALPQMSIGDKWRLWIPAELAYAGAAGKPQGMLVYDVELLDTRLPPVEAEPSKTIPAPPDVAGPPDDALKSSKGVSYKVLKAMPGARKPRPADKVSIAYTGWQTDGTMFDTSENRGGKVTFQLGATIDGWIDTVPLLGVGEKARLWVPAELGYPRGGGPSGMLVFDLEVLEIL